MKYECQKEPQFQCPYCDRKVKLKNNLSKHITRVHLKHMQQAGVKCELKIEATEPKIEYPSRRFSCSKCLRTYKYKYDLIKHVRRECDKEPSLECSVCNYRTHRTNTLNNHYRSKRHLIRLRNLEL
ncbi:unnamed protein product [Phyllotreta striolata]|uniref:C2H2-type domain-containing protein n=1 Tax=Phyllotreta striolata TaxID=444603 RepID=A0A9N9TW66_PHYSR|nr:unnamed protein product [Phyllotreta striolata]